MSIKRYGVITQSGHWYYIEDHTHFFGGKPTWKIPTQKGEFFVVGLLEHQMIITQDKIVSIVQFRNRQIFYGPKEFKEIFEATQGGPSIVFRTDIVVEIIEFQ